MLVHFDPSGPLLKTDASSYGIGAVISHLISDDSERQKAFASRIMSKSECTYAQYKQEGLSVTFKKGSQIPKMARIHNSN